jgi:4a-hydroxytetrahydrobiopterin dehydratase
MRHTPPLHTPPLPTSPNGLRGDFLGVRFLSIRAAIVGLFPFVSFHNPRHDPRSHARTRCQHTHELHDNSGADSMVRLAQMECIPCKGVVPPLKGAELEGLIKQVGNGWRVADEQNHHPDLCLSGGKVKITIWPDKIDGLTESDFVFAAKADQWLRSDTAENS